MTDDPMNTAKAPEESAPALQKEEATEPAGQPAPSEEKKENAPKRRSVFGALKSILENETVREIIAPSVVTIGGKIAYDKMFSRYERPDYSVTPGIRNPLLRIIVDVQEYRCVTREYPWRTASSQSE